MAAFKTVASVSEVGPGQLKHTELDDGTFYAIGGECTHMGGPLGEGELDGTTVTCRWHSAEFDITTGGVKGPPAEEPEPTYEVRVEGDEVQVAVE